MLSTLTAQNRLGHVNGRAPPAGVTALVAAQIA